MRFAELVDVSVALAATRGRGAKLNLLAELLRRASRAPPPAVAIVTSFLIGDLRQGKVGLGYATLRDVAAQAPPPPATPSLDIATVDRAFADIAAVAGNGAVRERGRLLAALLAAATTGERDFVVRLVTGELRQGSLGGLMSEAVARAAGLPAADVRRAAMLGGELPAVAVAALAEGAAGLARFRLTLFRPLQPMLAGTAGTVEVAFDQLRGDASADADAVAAAFELKLDGARIQVHRDGDEVRVYSRQLNDVTAAVPEVVAATLALPARRLILDGETLALRPDGSPLPFQVTMRRFGRRLEVDTLRRELPLSTFFFDLLHRDGEDLIDAPAATRAAALAAQVPGDCRVPRLVTAELDAAERFYDDAVARGHEGLMAKSLVAPYAAGCRGVGWLKLKPAHTLDLVVLAVEWGSGRRQGWLSNLHLGARDSASGQFVMLGKTFKGLTDELLTWQTRELLARETHRDDWTVYVRPELVVEVAFNDVQASPHYPAGMALRFARVKRYRPDKPAAEADTIDTVRAIFGKSWQV